MAAAGGFKSLFILCVLVSQVSASFFDEFPRAISSVENGLSKLINDVMVDVQDTIHCTIAAVEQVLNLNGVFVESSDYNKRCKSKTESIPPVRNKKNHDADIPRKNYKEKLNIDFKTADEIHKEHVDVAKDISKQVHSSIAKVNMTLENILGGNSIHEKLKHVRKTFKDETDHLTKLSLMLKSGINGISKNARNEFRIKKPLIDEVPINSAWDRVKQIEEEIKPIATNDITESFRNVTDKLLSEGHTNLTESDVFTNIAREPLLNDILNIDSLQSEETPPDHYSVFDLTPTTDDSHREALEQIIKDSAHTDMMMENLFNKQKPAAIDIFEHPSLLNYG